MASATLIEEQRKTVISGIATRFDGIIAHFKLRWPIWVSMLLLLASYACLRGTPFQLYWTYGFQALHLYETWPWLVLNVILLLPLLGNFEHSQTGRAMFFPLWAFLAACLSILILLELLSAWAIDWSVWWCIPALVSLGLNTLVLIGGCMCYTESWRMFCNEAVVTRVREALESDEFSDYLHGWRRPRWGSRHCLRIVSGYYDQAKEILWNQSQSPNLTRLLDECQSAGITLIEYLDLPFAEADDDEEKRLIRQVAPEVITTHLWAVASERDNRKINEELINWCLHKLENVEGGPTAYTRYLRLVFAIRGPVQSVEFLGQVFDGFKEVVADRNLREICANTWLAVASTYLLDDAEQPDHFSQQLVMDVWLAMRRHQGADIFVTRDNLKERSIAKLWARRQLSSNYTAWLERIPERWQTKLKKREESTNSKIKTDQTIGTKDIWGDVEEEARRRHSWPYLFVLKTRAVRQLLATIASFVVALQALVLVAVNPKLPFNWGWNTVEQVADRRPLHDYTQGDTRAMADSKNLIALATSKGLTFIDKQSRVPHTISEDGSIRDVARSLKPDAFVALADQGAITRWSTTDPSEHTTLLPNSDQPLWPTSSSFEPQIIANQLDENGWLVGVAGLGLARYRFGRLNDGRLFRTRAWQLGDLYNVPLQSAQVTKSGVWAMLDQGVRFVSLDTLKEKPARRLNSPKIDQFDADYQGRYAAAIDVEHSLWLYPPRDTGWIGPYFGRSELQTAADVTVARLVNGTAWLGTRYGLFGYDSRRRQMRLVMRNTEINQIVVGDNDPSALVSTNTGLFLVNNADGTLGAKQLDNGRIDSLSLSPDGKSCLYRRRQEGTGPEVRTLQWPFDKEAGTLLGPHGWKTLPQNVEMLGVKPLQQQTLFVTSAGSFLYDPRKGTYQDNSRSVFANREKPLTSFSGVVLGARYVLAVADDIPQVYLPKENMWKSLDFGQLTHPKQLVEVQDRIFGLGSKGELYSYDPSGSTPANYLGGESQALQRLPLATNTTRGDLLTNNGTWKLAFMHGGAVVTYDSASGNIADSQLPAPDTTQIRWDGQRLLYLTAGGQIMGEQKNTLFGNGSLPFAPDLITAITKGDNESVIVGGNNGQIYKYRWSEALWVSVGPSAIPGGGKIEMLNQTFAGLLVRTSGNRFFLERQKDWLSLRPYRLWAFDRNASDFWALDNETVVRFTPQPNPPTGGVEARFSYGSGLRAFLTDTAFIWQNDPSTAVFFTHGKQVGIYNATIDSWYQFKIETLRSPQRFWTVDNCVIVVDEKRVLRVSWINGELKAVQISEFPEGASLTVNGEVLHLAFVQNNRLYLRIWNKVSTDGYTEYQRGAPTAPQSFDPARVVYTEATGKSGVLLIDQTGNVMTYDWLASNWQVLRFAVAGQTMVGVVPGNDAAGVTLIIEAGPQLLSTKLNGSTYALDSADVPGLIRPQEGELLSNDDIHIVRSGNWTSYSIRTGDGWRSLRPQPGGFAEDFVQDLAISNTGQLWLLQTGQLSAVKTVVIDYRPILELTPRVIELGFYPATISEVINQPAVAELGFVQSDSSNHLVALNVGQRQLCWLKNADGSFNTFWRDAATNQYEPLPVWGTCGDRLASQCVNDIALTNGQLLLSTELGVVVRRPQDYQVQATYPELRGTRFVSSDDSTRVWLTIDGRIAFEWRSEGPVSVSLDKTNLITKIISGPWVWQHSQQGALSVSSQETNRSRTWSQTGNGWRFNDDIVTSISRGTDSIVLQTKDGLWTYNRSAGRGTTVADLPEDRWSVSNPAIKIDCVNGVISLHPFDSRAAFERGRFFFDSGIQLSGAGDILYTYLPRRGVVSRSAQSPAVVTGMWSVPNELVSEEDYFLETDSNQLRLRPRSGTAFVLRPDQPTQPWQGVTLEPQFVENNVGPVIWRREVGPMHRYETLAASSQRIKLDRWWSGDRFAWDDILSLGLFDNTSAIFVTAAGPMAVTINGNDFQTQELWPLVNFNSCDVAFEQGKRIGLALHGETTFPELLVTQSGGRLMLTTRESGVSLRLKPVLKVGFQQHSSHGRFIGISEQWRAVGDSALESDLGNLLTTGELVREGQFAYDTAISATPLITNGVADSTWLVASACSNPANSKCFLMLFSQAATNSAEIILRDLWRVPYRLTALRAAASNEVLALHQPEPQRWQPYRLSLSGGAPTWTTISFDEAAEAFRVGDRVEVDVAKLEWKRLGAQHTWNTQPLAITPRSYNLFSSRTDSLALSFDRMNSVAVDSQGKTLAVGTDGGLFLWPFNEVSPSLLSLGQTGGTFIFQHIGGAAERSPRIVRVRYDTEDNLLLDYGDNPKLIVIVDKSGSVRLTSIDPTTDFTVPGVFQISSRGIVVHGEWQQQSNNARFWQRQEIVDIVGYAGERDSEVLWLATRNRGVFKVLINKN